MAMHVCGSYLHYLCEEAEEAPLSGDAELEVITPDSEVDTISAIPSKVPTWSWQSLPKAQKKKFLVMALLVTNLPLALYTSLIHQRGPVDAVNFLYDESLHQGNESMSVIFLMSGHSTPYYR